MWVEQVTEPGLDGKHNEICQMLNKLYGGEFLFSVMMAPEPFIIARPVDGIMPREGEINRRILTDQLIDRATWPTEPEL